MSGYLPQHKGELLSSTHYTWNCADALGRGATAVVYLGRHKGTGQVVAVKVFHQHLRYSQCRDSDLPELEILRRLKHDNIIAVLGIEQEMQSKRTVLIMQYCEGGSVLSMLDQPQHRYGLPETQFLLLLYHVAAGMQYLRSADVVHRDIKPANIMRSLTEDGSSVYKLTDFGAARQLKDDENFTSMYGTEEYLHPEMYEKGVLRLPTDQQFDARMDLWSLGVTFYHVATGQLPFQAYGGRSNKDTMYRIISQKESGVISGQQPFEGGPVHWSRHLPPTCLLSSGVRQLLTPLLAGLVEADVSHMLSYEALFSAIQRLKSLVPLTVFDYLRGARHSLLLEPSCRLSEVKDAVASVTEVPVSQQLLVVGGQGVERVVVDPLTAFPTQLRHTTIYLFPREVAPSPPPVLPSPEIPPFPEFLDIVDVKNDPALALNCLSRGHLIQRHTDLIGQQQDCLLQGHLHLRMYVEARLRAVGELLPQLQQLVMESGKRFATFYSGLKAIQAMLAALGHRPDVYLTDILQDDTMLRVQKKMEERVEEIVLYRQGLEEKVMETQPHTTQWSERCLHTECHSKVDHQLTVISQVHSRFRRDKTVREALSPHDENIHRLERQRLQETCTRILSILTGHCVPALHQLHRQAVDWTGSLLRSLERVVKIEKNNESVINCQRLLSTRLDKLEAKCREEVEHLQRELMAAPRLTPTSSSRGQHYFVQPTTTTMKMTDDYHHPHRRSSSSVDEGLGTSVLGSAGSVPAPGPSARVSSSTSHPHPHPHQPVLSWVQSSSAGPRQESSETGTGTTLGGGGGGVGEGGGGFLDTASIQISLQSLRLDSEDVLYLLMENLDIIKRLQADSTQTDSRRPLSTIEEDRCPELYERDRIH